MQSPQRKATQVAKADAPRRFVFLLLDRFTMINFAGAIEPLRLANHVAGYPVYTWALAGEGGVEKSCSNGATFRLDFGLDEVERDDTILVCGGLDIQHTTTKGIIGWLRFAQGPMRWPRPGCWTAKRRPCTGKTMMVLPRNSKRSACRNPCS
jgi:AraC family transcriptional regulator, glycine betaine-responsive activator